MSRIFNFSAGPAMIPIAVIQQAEQEFLNWNGSGMNVMEMSHRGKEFTSIANKAEADLREVMAIPENYKVLFLQGGASGQFSSIPMNLLRGKSSADYFNTGQWSKKAIQEAKRYCDVNVVASSEESNFSTVPNKSTWKLDPDAAYVHYTANETIGGVEFDDIPDTGDVPLVVDLSSTILSRPIDVSRFGLIYAGAQKNMGPAGTTLVVVKKSILGKVSRHIPTILTYQTHIEKESMFNTPSVFAVYGCLQTLKWIDKQGLSHIEKINTDKSNLLYNAIDGNDSFEGTTAIEDRSKMNVTFVLKDDTKNAAFLDACAEAKINGIKGHRSVGGFRASMYNALGLDSVQALVDVMNKF